MNKLEQCRFGTSCKHQPACVLQHLPVCGWYLLGECKFDGFCTCGEHVDPSEVGKYCTLRGIKFTFDPKSKKHEKSTNVVYIKDKVRNKRARVAPANPNDQLQDICKMLSAIVLQLKK
jgi:hypothetical protein